MFGGGLALYNASGRLVGGIGVSGDSSCADHNIAWRTRNTLNLDYVPAGVSADATRKDNIVYDITPQPGQMPGVSASGWGHPVCSDAAKTIAAGLPGHALGRDCDRAESRGQRAEGRGQRALALCPALCPLPFAILTPEAVVRETLCLFAALLALANPAFSQTLPRGVQQKASLGGITEYDYPNGLRVLLFPDPSNPKVTVNVTYLVGSRHEGYGETGMAHLLEHMNFIRTTNGRNIKKELTDHGAQWNGTTDYDRTNYYETFTASDENLQWALGLEADRMVNMRIKKALLDTEMTVVRNEFERGENNAAAHPRGARRRRPPTSGTTTASPPSARGTISRTCPIDRLAAFYREVLPARQRRAGHRRPVRRIEGARHGGRHDRHDSAADAHARRDLHGRARAGRRAVRRAAPRGHRRQW